jgi:hypothetical protein
MIISSHDGGENESNIVLPVRASHALAAIRAVKKNTFFFSAAPESEARTPLYKAKSQS